MLRISNRMMYNNTLVNAFRNNQGLLKTQEELASGKRINRPSDDPTGMMEVLGLRTSIGKSNQYLKVMNNAESVLNSADSTIGAVNDQLKTAKELALQQAGGLANAATRITAAVKIDNMIEQMIQYGNTRVGSKYIFSGQRSDQLAINSLGKYTGSGIDLRLEINEGLEIPISVKASDFLTTDMNARLSTTAGATPVSSLNGGAGVTTGNFTITNRDGATATITLSSGDDILDVINNINSAVTDVTASLSSDRMAITLTYDDSTNQPTTALTVEDNAVSRSLGISGSWNNNTITGDDLDPAVTDTTLLADLYAGQGLALNDVTITHDSASATVTFFSETTVGAVRTTINAVATTIDADVQIDSAGRMLTIDSTSATSGTVSFAYDAGSGNTAELLGIGGGRNIIPVLQKLSAALKRDDQNGILTSIGLLDSNMENSSSVRGQVGSRANQVLSTREAVDLSKYNSIRIKSLVEDADFLKSASELAMLQTAYQATLKSSAAIIQPSLLDFM